MIKKLNRLKQEHGDTNVLLDLVNIQQYGSHDEYGAEETFDFKIEKLPSMNMDTGNLSKRKYKAVLIQITE